MDVTISLENLIEEQEAIELYQANDWSSAEKPAQLLAALRGSHSLVTARVAGELLGLRTRSLMDTWLCTFPTCSCCLASMDTGIGRKMMEALLAKCGGVHQLMLTADATSVEFYKQLGFERGGRTEPM